MQLALLGGPPVHGGEWPVWPRTDASRALAEIAGVLTGSRWTVRGTTRPDLATRRAERPFAERCGARHALLVTSGSTAVELALRALGAGPGWEVVVPALGWYATAAAVCRVGAVPVFADVDPQTSCLDPAAVAAVLTSRTAAVVAVHLHCAVADLRGLLAVLAGRGIPLVEDAAQGHGGVFEGLSVGSHGAIGCFSFNQEKALAIGEGGALVTSDEALHRRLHALRTDGYLPPEDEVYERPNPEVQGANYCLSEIQAALLLVQMAAFDGEHELRTCHADVLEKELIRIPGVRPLTTSPGTTVRPCYEIGMVLDLDRFGGWPLALVGRALAAEIGAPVHPTDVPVPESPLFDPVRRGSWATLANASALQDRLLVFHHRLLLDPAVCRVIPEALRKVQAAAGTLTAAQVQEAQAA